MGDFCAGKVFDRAKHKGAKRELLQFLTQQVRKNFAILLKITVIHRYKF
jgi:hypothetical protein